MLKPKLYYNNKNKDKLKSSIHIIDYIIVAMLSREE